MLYYKRYCIFTALLLMVSTPLLCSTGGSEIQIAGPVAAEEIVLALAAGYADSRGYGAGTFSVDYLRSGTFPLKENETPASSGM